MISFLKTKKSVLTKVALNSRQFSSSNNKQNVAFIGLGNMGLPMMENLISKSNFNVSVFDMSETVLKKAAEKGATVSKCHVTASKDASYVVTMLPGNDPVLKVYKDISEAKSCASNSLWIDCSTVDPHVSKQVSEMASKYQNKFVDAPVSGGVGGATAGTLTFMVGGEESSFKEAKEKVLAFMGKNIVHCGSNPGSGEIAKLCNNMILGISMCAVSEALNLGTKLGVDPKVLSNIVNTSSGRCWSSDTYNPSPGVMENVPSSKDYEGGFATSLMLKDLKLALGVATKMNIPTPITDEVKQVYETLEKKELGNKDFSVVFKDLSMR